MKLGNDTDKSSVEVLWTIDDQFKKFAQELADRGGHNLTGDDLRQADKDHGTKLFSGFTPEEQAAISQKGQNPGRGAFGGPRRPRRPDDRIRRCSRSSSIRTPSTTVSARSLPSCKPQAIAAGFTVGMELAPE